MHRGRATWGVTAVAAVGALLWKGRAHGAIACEQDAASNATICTTSDASRTSASGAYGAVPACASAAGQPDADGDGLSDACEETLAERYAPIVVHSSDESNWPTNVDAFLSRTTLRFYDDACAPDLHEDVVVHPTQLEILGRTRALGCGAHDTVRSSGTRSARKQRTFYLEDVDGDGRRGSADSSTWTTYVHAYTNSDGGVTLQYWRVYAYNDAMNDHGGDWEGVFVVLDRAQAPVRIALMGHSTIASIPWLTTRHEGSHVVVFAEGGGHATRVEGSTIRARGCGYAPCNVDLHNERTFVRQETASGGRVSWPDGHITPAGRLVNVGSKLAPANGQVFVQYSGVWGSPGRFYGTSGYWGPAYNETAMGADGYMTAWCYEANAAAVGECYPAGTAR